MKAAKIAIVLLVLPGWAGAAFAAEEKAPPTRAKDLAPPVRISAGGKPIEVDGGFAAPFVGDFDGDGKIDLLVGQYGGGKLRIYRNIGTNARPKFDKFQWFKAGGDVGRILAGCRVGFSPQLVDFEGDGRTDVLSGSFYGHLYLFRRTRDGNFAEARVLNDKLGNLIKFDGSYNSTAFAHDWDGDGDLDLLLVCRGGGRMRIGYSVWLFPNEGSNKKPAFGEADILKADGKPIQGVRAACVADWNGDGKDDLLVGCEGGNVLWCRNTGEKGKPVLEAPVTLVPKSTRLDDNPGLYARICVVDFNGDGRLDLLLGDLRFRKVKYAERTDEQSAAEKQVRARLSAAYEGYRKANIAPKAETAEARIERQKKIAKQLKQIIKARAALEKVHPSRKSGLYGNVWLFERK